MTSSNLLLILMPIAIVLIRSAGGFNVDVSSFKLHQIQQTDSMFGFSVALHRDKQSSWVLVGAPSADTSEYQGTAVRRAGAVYKCNPLAATNDNCTMLQFDLHGNAFDRSGNHSIEEKSHQWLGATVASAGADGPIVACAPRYLLTTFGRDEQLVGACFVADADFTSVVEFHPCEGGPYGFAFQSYGMAGFSAAITGERVFMGAPCSQSCHGQVFSYALNLESLPPTTLHDNKFATNDVKRPLSYTGYSMTSGHFDIGSATAVAIGMPRANGLNGKVQLYTAAMTELRIAPLLGDQYGAYFGYAMCAVDVDGDGRDDLLIGAPMYTKTKSGGTAAADGSFETGRVYIWIRDSKSSTKFGDRFTLEGRQTRGRFGLALASLGDINRDGYGDFAVAAPYESGGANGAVYIYHGSATGPTERASQVLRASDVGDSPRTFGFSVAGGLDVDDNGYPDVAVGAYESGRVYTFRSRAVTNIQANVTFAKADKMLALEDRQCTLLMADGTEQLVACVAIDTCLEYGGENLPASVEVDVRWQLDGRKSRAGVRMFFVQEPGRSARNGTWRLVHNERLCVRDEVYVRNDFRDKLTPLEVKMWYRICEPSGGGMGEKGMLAGPMLDPKRATMQRDSIHIKKNCGEKNVCVPDLRLVVEMPHEYFLRSKHPLAVNVTVFNSGQDAFEAVFLTNIPAGLNYRRVENVLSNSTVVCSTFVATDSSNDNSNTNLPTLKCGIGNPFAGGKLSRFRVHFETMTVSSQPSCQSSKFAFDMSVHSANAENEHTRLDNEASSAVATRTEAELSVRGLASESELFYDLMGNPPIPDNGTGPLMRNQFEIINTGPSDIETVEMFLVIPIGASRDDKLLYSSRDLQTSPNVECDSETDNTDLELQHQCNRTLRCVVLRCLAGPMPFNDTKSPTWIKMNGTLVAQTLHSIAPGEQMLLNTTLVARIVKMPCYPRTTPTFEESSSYTISTRIGPVPEPAMVPLWMYILAAIAGVLILLPMLFGLKRCGFFERKRFHAVQRNDDEELQPQIVDEHCEDHCTNVDLEGLIVE